MSLRGRIEHLGVPDLLQFIHLGRKTGTLQLRQVDGGSIDLGFHSGRLISAAADGAAPLGELLVTLGVVSRARLAWALSVQARATPRPALGRLLIEQGVVPAEAVYTAVREQMSAVVRRALLWRVATFHFHPDEVKPVDDLAVDAHDLVPEVHLDSQGLLLDALRREDERNAGAQLRQVARP